MSVFGAYLFLVFGLPAVAAGVWGWLEWRDRKVAAAFNSALDKVLQEG